MQNSSNVILILIISLSISHVKSSENCGQSIQINDKNLSSANWPWITSLFYYYNGQYFCTGTLISDKHVLSSAHCFSGPNFSTPHQQVFVILGRTNFTQVSPFEQIRNVTDIKIHPNWKKLDGNYDSDMAVLTFSDPVIFTEFVQPVCLPSTSNYTGVQEFRDMAMNGAIAGYKKSHEDHNVEFFVSQVTNITSCLYGDEAACDVHSDEFFCNSVSASGFYGRKEVNGSFKIYGIFSKGIHDDESEFCGLNNFVVFAFVSEYVDWIVSAMNAPVLNRNGRKGKELKPSSEIFCDFRWNYEQSDPAYTCIIRGLIIPTPYVEISNTIKGLHGEDDTDIDVNRIHITKSKTIYLPDTTTLAEKFPNSKNFWVSKSNLKIVERSKLQPLSKITILCFNENEIEELPEDSFVDLLNLEILWIYSNQITKLNENLLRNQKNLRIFDARNNLIKFLPQKLFDNNPGLKVINLSFNSLKEINVDFTEIKSLKWIVLDGNECIKMSYCKIYDCLRAISQLQNAINENC